ncbi:cytosine permease, partial [Acinetobacter sp. A11]
RIGITCYFLGILIQLPFIDSKFYTGQIAAMLGGIDLSWLVGLISTALIYYIFAKKAQLKFSKQLVIDQIK